MSIDATEAGELDMEEFDVMRMARHHGYIVGTSPPDNAFSRIADRLQERGYLRWSQGKAYGINLLEVTMVVTDQGGRALDEAEASAERCAARAQGYVAEAMF